MKVDRPEPQKDVFRLDETSLVKKRTYLQKVPQIAVPDTLKCLRIELKYDK